MIKKTIFVILLLSPVFVYCKSSTVTETLKELDACIEKRASFEEVKKKRIDHLEGKFFREKVSLANQYQLSAALFNEYRSYKYDSAYTYAGRMLQFALKIKDPNLIAESKMNLAFSCVSAGLFKEASEISNSIDTTRLSLNCKAEIYTFLSTLNIDMGDFSATEPFNSSYRKKSLLYCRKSIILLKQDSPEATMAKIRECQLMSDFSNAFIIGGQYLSATHTDMHDYAIIASTLGYFYQISRDTTMAIVCFSEAAIALCRRMARVPGIFEIPARRWRKDLTLA